MQTPVFRGPGQVSRGVYENPRRWTRTWTANRRQEPESRRKRVPVALFPHANVMRNAEDNSVLSASVGADGAGIAQNRTDRTSAQQLDEIGAARRAASASRSGTSRYASTFSRKPGRARMSWGSARHNLISSMPRKRRRRTSPRSGPPHRRIGGGGSPPSLQGVHLGDALLVVVDLVPEVRRDLRLGQLVERARRTPRGRRARRGSRREALRMEEADADAAAGEGFVHAHASPTAATPVAIGWSSTTKRRYLSRIEAIASTSVMGCPLSQCAWNGHAWSTLAKASGSRTLRSTVSAAAAQIVTDQVPLSPGRVRSENVPHRRERRADHRRRSSPEK